MSTLDGGRPTHGPLRRSSAALAVILTACVALLGPIRAATDEAGEAPEVAPTSTELPFFLQGLDLTLPSQEAFRDWPATELLTRPYWLPWSWLS